MNKLDKAIHALECCIESDETAECPPGCPFGGDQDCETKIKRLARELLRAQREKERAANHER